MPQKKTRNTIAGFLVTAVALLLVSPVWASSWGPTLLVNTEAFEVLDEGDASTNVYVQFGDALNKKLTYERNETRFNFDDDLLVTGDLSVSGSLVIENTISTKTNLTINSDNGAADAVLTFGSDTVVETLTFMNNEDRFQFSDDVHVAGNITASGSLTVAGAAVFGSTIKLNGVTYTFPTSDGTASGKVLKTDGAGQLVWSSDNDSGGSGISYADAHSWFVDDTGDTMTGGLAIHSSNGLAVTGAIITESNITLNSDNAAQDATITFGNDGGAETITFSNTNERFDVSDDAQFAGKIEGSGSLVTEGAVTTSSLYNATLSGTTIDVNNNTFKSMTGVLVWYVDGDLATGTEQAATLVLPFNVTVVDVEMHVKTAPASQAIIVDINENGTTIFSTRPQINASATTEAGTHAFSDTSLAKNSEISLDIDQVGSGTAGNGLTVQLTVRFDM